MEYFNPTEREVDLFDYELLVYESTDTPKGEPTGRIPLATERGTWLKSGGRAAVWPLTVKHYDLGVLTPEDFAKRLNSAYLYIKNPIYEDRLHVIPVDLTEVDAETGVRRDRAGICPVPIGNKCHTLLIVPRGGAADAVFTLAYNDRFTERDAPVLRSSYWGIAPTAA